MDGIQSYAAGHRPLVASVHSPTSSSSTATAKSPSDYLRAIRRRFWLALAVAIPVATAGTLYVLRMPPVYSVTASIEIKVPKVDPAVASLVSHGGELGRGDPVTDEKYVPDTLALLNSKSMLDEVVSDPTLGLTAGEREGDPAAELVGKIKTRQIPLSHYVYVTLEGRDPARITKILEVLLRRFVNKTTDESNDGSTNAMASVSAAKTQYIKDLEKIETDLATHIRESSTLAPGGRNLKEAEFDAVRSRLGFMQQQVGNLRNDLTAKAMTPTVAPGMDPSRASKIGYLQDERKRLNKRLVAAQRIARDPSDPAIKRASGELRDVEDELTQLANVAAPQPGTSPAEISEKIMADALSDIRATEEQQATVFREMKEAMPQYQKYTTLVTDLDNKKKQLAALSEKLSEFTLLARTRKPPVRIVDPAEEPVSPIRPNKPVYIAACIFMGTALGLALVCFLEHIDHSVKVPEHLTAGLALPLFGVVPRIRRLARNHRGGHLWTPGIPDSIEADAYRNLRASLLGATRDGRPIMTLLVTSAKAGEGKSTTALNLAATCARAGERTLLMDVDLRRPSLNGVFPRDEDGTGLVDVLRGDLPWQRTVVQTDLPNLDFLPTGDTRDVPIEVLGSLELRQLLISLSQHHYDRVILDGPAVLGLADCRMLGRIVDAALLVVRSGSQELRPLQRAKAMLEQSMVTIAGVVFNGLSEDLQNWSSYGPNPMLDSSMDLVEKGPAGASRGLDAPGRNAAALMAAGAVEA